MTTAVSSISRPLRIFQRGDLSVTPQMQRGRRYWVIKDPVSLSYYHLRDEDYAILSMLDGTVSLDDLREQFDRQFAPRRITAEELRGFIAMLHRSGLVVSSAAGQGGQLLVRRATRKRRALLSALANVLAIRFRGIDPEPLLRRLSPIATWLFSPVCVTACLMVSVAAVLLVSVQFDVLQSRLPAFETFFATQNVLWLLATLASVKVLHEFGHALACKRYGGECHEIGLMLLAMTPCLYCNVSDSWRLPNKWHRVLVSAAGMYVEIWLAAICTFLWWFSLPGLFHMLCLNVMFVCSISTVVFNGNPLLRYDAYYMLSDAIEVPNLWQRSRAVVHDKLSELCLGWKRPPSSQHESGKGLLAGYAIASMAYRLFVVVAILWFVYGWLAGHGAESIGRLLAVIVVVGLLSSPIAAVYRFANDPLRRRRLHRGRLTATMLIAAVVIFLLLWIPLPHSVTTPVVARMEEAQPVYVTADGTIVRTVEDGGDVATGDVLAELSNPELMLDHLRLRGERDRQQQHVESLKSQRVTDPKAAEQLPAALAELARLNDQLQQAEREVAQLTLRSPIAGKAIAPFMEKPPAGERLSTIAGSPLDPRNRGAMLKTGTLLCLVGKPSSLEAVAFLDEDDVESVASGQNVTIVFEQHPGKTVQGTVIDLSRSRGRNTTRSLVFGETPESDARSDQMNRKPTYIVRIRLTASSQGLLVGAGGSARIRTAPQSLGRRALRVLQRTFTFDVPRTAN